MCHRLANLVRIMYSLRYANEICAFEGREAPLVERFGDLRFTRFLFRRLAARKTHA